MCSNIYPRTVVSVSQHYKDNIERVGQVESVIRGAGTAYLSGIPEFTPGF